MEQLQDKARLIVLNRFTNVVFFFLGVGVPGKKISDCDIDYQYSMIMVQELFCVSEKYVYLFFYYQGK